MPVGTRPDPPTRCCKLSYTGDVDGAPWANIMWLFLTGSGVITHADLLELAAQCGNSYQFYFRGGLTASWELTQTQVVLYETGEEPLEAVDASTYSGAAAPLPLPANIALCISWHIAPHYRGGHPRTYLAGLPMDATANNTTWAGDVLGGFNEAATLFHESIESLGPIGSGISTVLHGVVSFVRDNEWRAPPVFYRINSGTVDSRIDSQRRRLGRDRT